MGGESELSEFSSTGCHVPFAENTYQGWKNGFPLLQVLSVFLAANSSSVKLTLIVTYDVES